MSPTKWQHFLMTIFVLFCFAFGNFAIASISQAQDKQMSQEEFYDTVRELWEDHIGGTRLYIVSFAAEG